MGTVIAVCISEAKGTRKRCVPSAVLVAGHGLENDAHAGPGQLGAQCVGQCFCQKHLFQICNSAVFSGKQAGNQRNPPRGSSSYNLCQPGISQFLE